MWLYILLYALAIVWIVLGIFEWVGTKKAYEQGRVLSKGVSIGWGVLSVIGISLICVTSFFSIWPLPINEKVALIGGFAILGIGIFIMMAGMIDFHSFSRVMGQDTSKLVTTGVYRWSRNPQLLGAYLLIFGISLIGRSGLAFLFTAVGVLYFHLYIIKLEEPFLERVFGEEYHRYKIHAPRYIRMPKKMEK